MQEPVKPSLRWAAPPFFCACINQRQHSRHLSSHTAHWLVLDSSVEASHADSSVQRHRADPDDRAAAGPAAPAAPRPGQRPAHCGHSLPSSSQSNEHGGRGAAVGVDRERPAWSSPKWRMSENPHRFFSDTRSCTALGVAVRSVRASDGAFPRHQPPSSPRERTAFHLALWIKLLGEG